MFRLTTFTTFCVLILLLAVLPSVRTAFAGDPQPSALELLDRAHRNKSILDDDSLGVASRSPGATSLIPRSIGFGVDRIGIVIEYSDCFSKTSAFGSYAGLGVGVFEGAYWNARTASYHAGLCSYINDQIQCGLGLEMASAAVRVFWGSTSGSATATSWGPHAWIEAGSPRGFAIRGQLSQIGPGVSFHCRF